ncbi:MAG: VTT domain-containing protein [Acidobacteria bacterium]|nr:VTT domain-containing protein [Acidobacteriota bacterium]
MKAFAAKLAALGPGGIFLLALLDSAGVPIPAAVDTLVLLVATLHPGEAWLAAAAAVAGSMLGSLGLFWLARKGGQRWLARYTATDRGQRWQRWFRDYGLITVFIPAFLVIPMPLKIPLVCSAALGVRTRQFALVMLAARMLRYTGLAWLGRTLGEHSTVWLKQHTWHMVGVATALFALLALAVRFSARQRQPAVN